MAQKGLIGAKKSKIYKFGYHIVVEFNAKLNGDSLDALKRSLDP